MARNPAGKLLAPGLHKKAEVNLKGWSTLVANGAVVE